MSPGYLNAIGTRLIAGRDFTWTDLSELRPVVIVSENLARESWGTASAAIGKRIQTLPNAPWREVIGVVQNVSENGVHEPPPTTVYWPTTSESPYRAGQIDVTRTADVRRPQPPRRDRALPQRDSTRGVVDQSRSLPVAAMQTQQAIYDRSMSRTSFTLAILAIAGLMALTLGIVGIYGVISYAVAQRTREIGIRLALGAQRGELTRMFVRSGVTLVCLGVPIGLAAAAGAHPPDVVTALRRQPARPGNLPDRSAAARHRGHRGQLPAGPPCRVGRSLRSTP